MCVVDAPSTQHFVVVPIGLCVFVFVFVCVCVCVCTCAARQTVVRQASQHAERDLEERQREYQVELDEIADQVGEGRV